MYLFSIKTQKTVSNFYNPPVTSYSTSIWMCYRGLTVEISPCDLETLVSTQDQNLSVVEREVLSTLKTKLEYFYPRLQEDEMFATGVEYCMSKHMLDTEVFYRMEGQERSEDGSFPVGAYNDLRKKLGLSEINLETYY